LLFPLALTICLPNSLELTHGRRLAVGVAKGLRRSTIERSAAHIPLLAVRMACYGAFFLYLVVAGPRAPSEFLYFNF
jgi:hypothetical protein